VLFRSINIEPHGAAHGTHWLSNDRLIFTSHVSDSINELDVPSGKIVRTMPTGQKGTHLLSTDAENKNAYAVNAFSGTITAFNLLDGKVTKQIGAGQRAEGISISPDGSLLACGNVGGNDTSIIDTKKLEVIHTIKETPAAIRTVFTKDGKHLAISCVGSGTVEVFETKTWQKTATVELKQKPIANKDYGNEWPAPMNFWLKRNGNLLVVLVTSHAIAEINTKTWKVTRTFDTGPIPDGLCVAE
jgi:DNA-binding beta-propeller fold protein YncE